MKKKKKIFLTIVVVAIIFGGLYATTYIPKKLISINPSEVSKLEIFDGNQGKALTVSDGEHIKHIITNLNGITFSKGKSSLGYLGYRFRMTIYDEDGDEQKVLIINSNDKVRYKGFFYTDPTKRIDIDYIDSLF
ncbi:hypothetical protein [Ornithinibacillus californiensis]|uniref:hypothetical protein n=1 Tax=Ornithinibacillus californiensis TaxID=161536 RepID=UPI00064E0B5F|nr:hypothetical protein [Ornithinibacillus californiensis]